MRANVGDGDENRETRDEEPGIIRYTSLLNERTWSALDYAWKGLRARKTH